jgi:hypothetical protein
MVTLKWQKPESETVYSGPFTLGQYYKKIVVTHLTALSFYLMFR